MTKFGNTFGHDNGMQILAIFEISISHIDGVSMRKILLAFYTTKGSVCIFLNYSETICEVCSVIATRWNQQGSNFRINISRGGLKN